MKQDPQKNVQTQVGRRKLLAGAAAIPLVGLLPRRGEAAEFTWKFATGQDPSHPVNVRAAEAIKRIQEATSGRLDIKLFPANQLGSDTDLISQVRSGGVELVNTSASIVATLAPLSGMVNLGFAFTDFEQIWKAMDGGFGDVIRAQIARTGIVPIKRIGNNGFRQVTSSGRKIRTPDDLKGFKIRVPVAPLLTSLFESFGASPTAINFNEVYMSLQTKVVDGQENALPLIHTTKLYEVQNSISMTGHSWDGFWVLANRRALSALPNNLQDILMNELDAAIVRQRADVTRLSDSLRPDLQAKGCEFIDVDRNAFREVLSKTSYYRNWRARFGEEAWKSLEQIRGPL